MNIEDHILRLAVKKLASEATLEELYELDNLLNKYPDAFAGLKLLLEEWVIEEQISEEESRRVFDKIRTRINHIEQPAASDYKRQPE